MRNTIRFISTLALVLALGVITGCSGGGSNTKTPGDTGSTDGSGGDVSGSGDAGSDTGSDAASGDSSSNQSSSSGSDTSGDSTTKSTNGIITTVVGTGTEFFSGDGGLAIAAELIHSSGIAFDPLGNLYVASYGTHKGIGDVFGLVRRIDKQTGIITTVAGGGSSGQCSECLATSATLSVPSGAGMAGVILDPYGNLYFTDVVNARVAKVDTKGIITTVSGGVKSSIPGPDGSPAINARYTSPMGIAFDSLGNLYVADGYLNIVRRIDKATNTISTVAGSGTGQGGSLRDGCPARWAGLYNPGDIKFDSSDNLYIADVGHQRVRRVDKNTGIITTIAGGGTLFDDNVQAIKTSLNLPRGIAFDSFGNLYVADAGHERIRKVDTNGVITTVAGGGASPLSYSGDGGPAINATLSFGNENVQGLAFDSAGNLYISDSGNNRIRMVTAVASSTDKKDSGPVTTYTVGGTVTGLSTGTLVLHNGADNLQITNSQKLPTLPFLFQTPVANNSTYYATVQQQPLCQYCEITDGCGVVSDGNVQTISVTCNPGSYTVGGSVAGLNGTLVLQINGSNTLTIKQNGSFTSPSGFPCSTPYSYTIKTQPSGQTCIIGQSSGIISGTVQTISVICN